MKRSKHGSGQTEKGDMVLIALPPDETALANSALWHFEGMETTISKVKSVKTFVYYELDGVKSKYGVPYGLLKDWLIKVKE